MTQSLRRSILRHISQGAIALAVGAAGAPALAGDLTDQLNFVDTPPQNVCRGNGCAVNTESYAWHQTQWRRWPGTPTVLPSPGRGDRAEAVPPRPQFDMPAPSATSAPAGPRMQGTGVRAPRPAVAAPSTPRVATPPEATSDSGIPNGDEAMPPINLDDILRDDAPTPPATRPETTPPADEIPPPFDSKRSGGAPKRDANRTLNALTAGLNGGRATAKPSAPHDPWKAAAPVRKVTGEKSAPEGPVLNEPNLMSAPDDGPQLQATPEAGEDSGALWKPVSDANLDGGVTPAANWEEADVTLSAPSGSNPLRAAGSGDRARSNPLRRR